MPAKITLRQTHPSYAFMWHDEKSVLFSRRAYTQIHPDKKRRSGFLIVIILLSLIILTSVLTYAYPA
jgi:hypothetical protein